MALQTHFSNTKLQWKPQGVPSCSAFRSEIGGSHSTMFIGWKMANKTEMFNERIKTIQMLLWSKERVTCWSTRLNVVWGKKLLKIQNH